MHFPYNQEKKKRSVAQIGSRTRSKMEFRNPGMEELAIEDRLWEYDNGIITRLS